MHLLHLNLITVIQFYLAFLNLSCRLQRILNTAARIVSLTPKYTSITETLALLHWLPVRERIEFKILLLTYKALNSLAPPYISSLINVYEPPRSLRSSNSYSLVTQKVQSVFGQRAFSYSAPLLWNSIPLELRLSPSLPVFKKNLKTHLCQKTFY